MIIMLVILGLLLLIYLLFAAFISYFVLVNKLEIEEISEGPEYDEYMPFAEQSEQWALNNGFKFVGCYAVRVRWVVLFIAAWEHPEEPTYICQYLSHSESRDESLIEITTEFAAGVELNTGNSAKGAVFPTFDNIYRQSFSGISLQSQWDIHLEMQNFLIDQGGAQLAEDSLTFEESYLESAKKQHEYILIRDSWLLRIPYWYIFHKRRWSNKSVKVQHESGMIKLPNELELNISN